MTFVMMYEQQQNEIKRHNCKNEELLRSQN